MFFPARLRGGEVIRCAAVWASRSSASIFRRRDAGSADAPCASAWTRSASPARSASSASSRCAYAVEGPAPAAVLPRSARENQAGSSVAAAQRQGDRWLLAVRAPADSRAGVRSVGHWHPAGDRRQAPAAPVAGGPRPRWLARGPGAARTPGARPPSPRTAGACAPTRVSAAVAAALGRPGTEVSGRADLAAAVSADPAAAAPAAGEAGPRRTALQDQRPDRESEHPRRHPRTPAPQPVATAPEIPRARQHTLRSPALEVRHRVFHQPTIPRATEPALDSRRSRVVPG